MLNRLLRPFGALSSLCLFLAVSDILRIDSRYLDINEITKGGEHVMSQFSCFLKYFANVIRMRPVNMCGSRFTSGLVP